MLARTHKDLWAQTREPDARRRHLESAFHWYLDAHMRSGGYWSGINVATVALLMGKLEESRALARRVRDRCLERRIAHPGSADAYWLLATLGEAPFTLGAQLVGLLFADVEGFSKLTETQIPRFVENYMGLVAKILDESPEQSLLRNGQPGA